MSTLRFIVKTLAKKWYLLVIVPMIAAMAVFFMLSRQPKMYKSNSTIYTGIVSGYDVLASESKTNDWMSVNNAIENLMSVMMAESTLKNVSMRLLARNVVNLGKEDEGDYMTPKSAAELNSMLDDSVRALVVDGDEQATYKNFIEAYDKGRDNWFQQMFHWNHRHYSFKALSNIKVNRVGSSDMISMSYVSDDPYVSYNTLLILQDEFVKQYLAIRYQQTNDVVDYFEKELDIIEHDLSSKERGLTAYNVDNSIINYQEQTRMVAERSRDLDTSIEQVMRERDGAEQRLQILEDKLGHTTELYTQNAAFVSQINSLNKLYTQAYRNDSTKVAGQLDHQISQETDKLKKLSKEITASRYSKEGIANDAMVAEWLNVLLIKSKSDAELQILYDCKAELDKELKRFSPIGSSIKKQEREINFAERNYLSNLQALNEAKLRQKNLQLTSATFKVLTPPAVALYPESTKTKLFAMIAFVLVFFLVCGVVLFAETLNRKPYDKWAAQKLIDLPVLAAYPRLKDNSENSVLCGNIAKRFLGNVTMNHFDRNQTVNIINVFSVSKGEGNSLVCEVLKDYFETIDAKPLIVDWEKDFNHDTKYYLLANSIYDFCVNEDNMELMPEANVIIVEYPPLNMATFPIRVLNTSALNLLVVDASKDWTGMNSLLVNELRRFAENGNMMVVLNNSDMDTVGSFTGMLPPFTKLHKLRYALWNLGANDREK